jgi:hypothetical protein
MTSDLKGLIAQLTPTKLAQLVAELGILRIGRKNAKKAAPAAAFSFSTTRSNAEP